MLYINIYHTFVRHYGIVEVFYYKFSDLNVVYLITLSQCKNRVKLVCYYYNF